MARIRYLKPDFFLDFELSKLPAVVRLCYQGLWCHADREGRCLYEPEKLKVQIIPWEKISVEKCMEYLSPRWVVVYQDSKGVWLYAIRNFLKHQTPHSTEKESELEPPTDFNASLTLNNAFNGEGNGEEKEKGNGECANGTATSQSPKALFDLWNKTVAGSALAVARELSKDRVSKCRLRLQERPLERWEEIFRKSVKTPFLNGANYRGWRATFDWFLANPSNAVKVLEGKYDDRGKGGARNARTENGFHADNGNAGKDQPKRDVVVL